MKYNSFFVNVAFLDYIIFFESPRTLMSLKFGDFLCDQKGNYDRSDILMIVLKFGKFVFGSRANNCDTYFVASKNVFSRLFFCFDGFISVPFFSSFLFLPKNLFLTHFVYRVFFEFYFFSLFYQ